MIDFIRDHFKDNENHDIVKLFFQLFPAVCLLRVKMVVDKPIIVISEVAIRGQVIANPFFSAANVLSMLGDMSLIFLLESKTTKSALSESIQKTEKKEFFQVLEPFEVVQELTQACFPALLEEKGVLSKAELEESMMELEVGRGKGRVRKDEGGAGSYECRAGSGEDGAQSDECGAGWKRRGWRGKGGAGRGEGGADWKRRG